MDEKELYLVYIEPIGKNLTDEYEYEFIFSETPDVVWGTNWEQTCPSVCGDLRPDSTTYTCTKRLKTNILFNVAQENSCFSMQDVIDGILSLGWVFGDSMALTFSFSEKYNEVEDKLNKINLKFEK